MTGNIRLYFSSSTLKYKVLYIKQNNYAHKQLLDKAFQGKCY